MLSLFPLNLVVFPQESLNLHIFENRYRQLIGDCLKQRTNFGIPFYLNGQVQEFGTEVQIVEVSNQYEDGRLDIKTKGVRVFRLDTFVNPIPNKLHAGGEVAYIQTTNEVADSLEKIWFLEELTILYEVLNVQVSIKDDLPFLSYYYAHKVGLSHEQEYELLQILTETERLQFLTTHLKKTVPVVREMERTKSIIKMNGHFKHLDPLKF